MYTLNGIGSKFYGHKALTPNEISQFNASLGSYIATKWFVIFDIPIIPLESVIITGIINKEINNYGIFSSTDKDYKIIKLDKTNKKQIFRTYLLTFLFFILVISYVIGIYYSYKWFSGWGILAYNAILVAILYFYLKH